MQFVQGLPSGVYVGQTRVHHAKAQASSQPELLGFNLALHVGDAAKRVQQHRMALLQEFVDFGVDILQHPVAAELLGKVFDTDHGLCLLTMAAMSFCR